MLRAADVIRLQESHDQPAGISWHTIADNRRCNALLWDAEDRARLDRHVGQIVACKRSIDPFNQQSNNATERVDELLLAEFESLTGRPNSKTPGIMINRPSIVTLGNRNFNRHWTAEEGSWPCLQRAEVRQPGRIQR